MNGEKHKATLGTQSRGQRSAPKPRVWLRPAALLPSMQVHARELERRSSPGHCAVNRFIAVRHQLPAGTSLMGGLPAAKNGWNKAVSGNLHTPTASALGNIPGPAAVLSGGTGPIQAHSEYQHTTSSLTIDTFLTLRG